MKLRNTSPLDISILLHYYCSPRDVSNINAPAVQESIEHFLEIGLLKNSKDEGVRYEANREALEVYINALCNVPFPVNKWVIDNK